MACTHTNENKNGEKKLNHFDNKKEEDFPHQRTADAKINESQEQSNATGYKIKDLRWRVICYLTVIHLNALFALLTFSYFQGKSIFIFNYIWGAFGGVGLIIGVHRYWSHKSFKANLPLRIILMLSYSASGMPHSIYQWARDHRVHHKATDTNADPYNSTRGFFFSHIGWYMMKKRPEVIKKGNILNLKDLEDDPIVKFEQQHSDVLKLIFCIIMPSVIAYYWIGESWYWSFQVSLTRQVLVCNGAWLVNSAAHMFGKRPYDKLINPRENSFVSYWTLGEGWHNYHHTFPWDYRASELGKFNPMAGIINMFAWLGWAYDLKFPSPELVHKVIRRSGDGSYDWGGREIQETEKV